MKEWKGVIEKKTERDWNGTMLYSFRLKGVDRWFRTGKSNIPFAEGEGIKFSERNSTVQMDTLMACADATAPEPVGEVQDTPTRVVAGDVGRRIQWQAARQDAANVIVAALHTEALPWAKNTAKNQKLDLLVGYIHEVARAFIEEEDKYAD